MPRKKTHRLIYSGVLTLLTMLAWTGFETHHRLSQPKTPNIPPHQLSPLDPQLNTQLLEQLKARKDLGKKFTPPEHLAPSPPQQDNNPNFSPTPQPSPSPLSEE